MFTTSLINLPNYQFIEYVQYGGVNAPIGIVIACVIGIAPYKLHLGQSAPCNARRKFRGAYQSGVDPIHNFVRDIFSGREGILQDFNVEFKPISVGHYYGAIYSSGEPF